MKNKLDQKALVDYILPFMAPFDTGLKGSDGLTRFRCPHTDHKTDPGDYRIWINEKGIALSYCYACHKGGMKMLYEDLGHKFPPDCAKRKFDVLKWWSYTDAYGKETYQIALIDVGGEKPIKRPRHHDPYEECGWKYSTIRRDGSKITSTLYNLKMLYDLKLKGGLCLYCEGESDAEEAIKLGFLGTCHPFGAESFKTRYVKALEPFDIVIFPDNDPAGLRGALRTASECYGKVKSVKLMDVFGEKPDSKYDFRDWIEDMRKSGLNNDQIRTELMDRINNTPHFNPDNYQTAPEPGTKKRGKGKVYDISVDPKYSEEGLAQRLIDRHGKTIRFCGDYGIRGVWFYFDGVRWAKDTVNHVDKLVTDTIRSVLEDIEESQRKTEIDQKRYEWLQQLVKISLTAFKIRNIKYMAQSKVPIYQSEFNKQETTQYILNTPNGMIDLRKKNPRLMPHDPGLFITQVTSVGYYPDAQASNFMRFIREFSNNRPELEEYNQKALGIGLLGNNNCKKGFFLKGESNTGKTTLLEIIMQTLGFDYSHKFNISLICVSSYKKSEQLTPELASLHWKRFAVTSEGDRECSLDNGKFKEMTGGNTQSANPKYKDPMLFKPCFTMYIDTNDIPHINNPDQAMRNRIVIIPCDNIVTEGQDMDETLFDKLTQEREGILAWLADGCQKALKEGLNPPDCVQNIIKRFWENADIYIAWLNNRDYVIPDKDGITTVNEALHSFEIWCENRSLKPSSKNTFKKDMNDIQRYVNGIPVIAVDKIEGTKAVGWSGFRVRNEEDDTPDNNQ